MVSLIESTISRMNFPINSKIKFAKFKQCCMNEDELIYWMNLLQEFLWGLCLFDFFERIDNKWIFIGVGDFF